MKRTANLTLQVNVDTIDREEGTARVSVPFPDRIGRHFEMIVPLDSLTDITDDHYAGWTVTTLIGETPAAGAAITDAHGRPRMRFYLNDMPGGATLDEAADRAHAFLDHLREHYPEGM